MIEVFEIIVPGVSFFCCMALFVLASIQANIYARFGLKRSKNLALFCLISGLFTISVTVVYSQAFSVLVTRIVVLSSILLMFLAHFYYSRCLSFFIAIPRGPKKGYEIIMLLLTALAVIPLVSLLIFQKELFFNPKQIEVTGRFFSDAYLARLGDPYTAPLVGLSLFSIVHILFSFLLLKRLSQSSQDGFLIAGLVFNIVASGMEFLVLPLSVAYYVPMLYLSNLFEAFRMTSLSVREAVLANHNEEDLKITKAKQDRELDDEKIGQMKKHLVKLMEKEKLYLNSNLKLDDLAHRARIPSYKVSQVIRFGINKNFFTWLLEYRIEEVKRKLEDEECKEKTIMDIAFESGFNSKSSFNAIFKKEVGKTPTEYRKQFISSGGSSPPRI